ncbi:hypothetical protein IQ06DRAFT_48243 [Phaeosphaeriaceae sp. SRC1lsM3a]|nr:hypothetical protein IQ06DRAFT_48243 [Stagonospora sp. SRC1lsM3a]
MGSPTRVRTTTMTCFGIEHCKKHAVCEHWHETHLSFSAFVLLTDARLMRRVRSSLLLIRHHHFTKTIQILVEQKVARCSSIPRAAHHTPEVRTRYLLDVETPTKQKHVEYENAQTSPSQNTLSYRTLNADTRAVAKQCLSASRPHVLCCGPSDVLLIFPWTGQTASSP